MGKKIIITAAVAGSRPTKEMNPAVPYTPKEIVDAAVDSHKAGAAIVHIHVRDPKTGKSEYRIDLFKEVMDGIREKCDMIVNISTSGVFLTGSDFINPRLERIRLKPDICTIALGSINVGDRVVIDTLPWWEAAIQCMRENGVIPEIELVDAGHITQLYNLLQKGLFDEPIYCQLCLGMKWGIDASVESFLYMKSKLPPNAVWGVLGVGQAELPMITMGMLWGGNVRVGLEDNIFLRKGVLARSNAELVEDAANLAERLGRQVATSEEARRIIGIKNS
jgi:3-keto-5-aminohexanoate cleavage enzyme